MYVSQRDFNFGIGDPAAPLRWRMFSGKESGIKRRQRDSGKRAAGKADERVFLVAFVRLFVAVDAISDLLFAGEERRRPEGDVGIVPLGVPLIICPAALTTLLVLLHRYGCGRPTETRSTT